jgi:hypothetical protein
MRLSRTTLPETGYLRLHQIVGSPKADPPIPPLIPISKSTWWAGVKKKNAFPPRSNWVREPRCGALRTSWR